MRFEDLPPEIQELFAAQQEEMERARMQHNDALNQMHSFMFTQTREHTLILANMLGMIADNPEPGKVANYYEGMVRGHMVAKFDVCPTHGINHTDDALGALLGSTDVGDKATPPRSKEEGEAESELLAISEYEAKLNIYNMHEAPSDANLNQVQCNNCGLLYPSLEDRMLKEPDDCHGCHLQAAHG